MPTTRELARMMGAMIAIYCGSYPAEPAAVTLDIDDTCGVVHGYQQLSFWNGHYGTRCFLPIHVYDTAAGRPVAMLLRTGKTPSGAEAAGHIRRLIRHIRRHWPTTHITIRGDGHSQGRGPRHRKRISHPGRLRLGMPRCRSLPEHRNRVQTCSDLARAAVPPNASPPPPSP